MHWERSAPFGMIVDSSGKRFMNESASSGDCGYWQYERNQEAPAIPAYLMADSRDRKYYLFGMMPPRMTPKEAYESGFMVKVDSPVELAHAFGIDTGNLEQTAQRFNPFGTTGRKGHRFSSRRWCPLSCLLRSLG